MEENMGKKLKILFVSAEVAPYAKTGGLADVAGSLPQKLVELGHDVRVVLPCYKEIDYEMDYVTDFQVELDKRNETCIVKRIKNAPVLTYTLNNYHYYGRCGIYCHHDDGERFAFLSKASLELIKAIGFKPDILHLNDWHAAPAALLLKEHYRKKDPFYEGIKTLLTIHNLEYQGHFGKEILDVLGLPESFFVPESVEFYGMFNFLKAGVVYSDKINTVSRTYAQEILTPQYGERMEGILKTRENDLHGIVNGISYEVFNPLTDPLIYFPFSEDNLAAKTKNKYALQREMGLPESDVPLIGVVHRLVDQKGLNLVCDCFEWIIELNTQFILLGLGDPFYENAFLRFMERYPDRVSVKIAFDEKLAHRIYAGSDIFLMPSAFEPCGLGQMISLRYGTIPVVRETGGLKDTITDVNHDFENGNGFTFKDMDSEAFLDALERAVLTYRNEPGTWLELVRKGMKSDFSWNKAANEYVALYNKILEE